MTCTCKGSDACSECPPARTPLADLRQLHAQASDRLSIQLRRIDANAARDVREYAVAVGVLTDKVLALEVQGVVE